MGDFHKMAKVGKRGKAGVNLYEKQKKFMENSSEAAGVVVQSLLQTIELISANQFFKNELKKTQVEQRDIVAQKMKFQLRRLGPHNQITVLPVTNGNSTWTAGRGSNSDIYILSQYVSRTHFSIKYRNKKFYIYDHGSANGTYINDTRIHSQQEYPLPLDSIISIGVATRHQNDPDCMVFVFETCKEEKLVKQECKIEETCENTGSAGAEVGMECDPVETHVDKKRKKQNVKIEPAEQLCQKPTPSEELDIEIIEVPKKVPKSELSETWEGNPVVKDNSLKPGKSEPAWEMPDRKELFMNKTEIIAKKESQCSFNAAISAEVDLFDPEGYADDEILDAFEAQTQVDEPMNKGPKLSYSLTEDVIEISDSEDDGGNDIKTEMGPISYVQPELEDDDYEEIICLDVIKSENKENYPMIEEITIEDDDEYTETDVKWMGKLFKTKEECCSFIQSQRDDVGSGESGESESDWVDAVRNSTEELRQIVGPKGVEDDRLLETTDNIKNITPAPKLDKLTLDQLDNAKSVVVGLITLTQESRTVPKEVKTPDPKKPSPSPPKESSPVEKPKRGKLHDPYEFEDDRDVLKPAAKKRKIASPPSGSNSYKIRLLNEEPPIVNKTGRRPAPKTPKPRRRSTKKMRKPISVLPISEIKRIRDERRKKLRETCSRLPQNQVNEKKKPEEPEVHHPPVKLVLQKINDKYSCKETQKGRNTQVNSDKPSGKLSGSGAGERYFIENEDETGAKKRVEGTSTQRHDSCQRVLQISSHEEGNEVSKESALCDNLASCRLENDTNVNVTDTRTAGGVLKSCLKKYGYAFMRTNRPIVAAKSVSFDSTRNIRYYETDNRITMKTSSLHQNKPRITSEMRLIRQKYAFISEMCKWNPKWLEESKTVGRDELPPTFQREKLKHVQKSFPNHDNYMKTFLPLLLVELWSHVIQRWQMNGRGLYRFTANFKSYVEDPEFRNENLGRITCESVLEDQVIIPTFVREGDLVVIQITKPSVNGEGNESGSKKCIFNTFGYVEKVTVMKEDPKKINPSSAGEKRQRNSSSLLRIEILVLKRPDYLSFSSIMVPITGVYYTNLHLVMCQAVSMLPKSPLCQTILVPNQPMMALSPSPCNENLFYNGPFDDLQKSLILRLVSSCINRDHALLQVQGGPGTGKTHVIMGFILQLLYTKLWKEGPRPVILFCSHSNIPVDYVTLKLKSFRESMSKESRYKLVRFGRVGSMKPEVRDVSTCSLGFRNDRIIVENKIKALNETINALVSELETLTASSVIKEKSSKLHACVKERDMLKKYKPVIALDKRPSYESERLVVEKADVICTTFGSCASKMMVDAFERIKARDPKRKIICIVDEAMQSKECETIVPLLLGVTHLILVGDSRQLKSPVRCELVQQYGLNQSLFWRLLSYFQQSNHVFSPVTTLMNQYRMNSAISALPCKLLYQGFLKDACWNQKKYSIQNYVVLIDNAPPESSIEECERRLNEIAVTLVTEVLNTMGNEIGDKTLGVITCKDEHSKTLKTKLSEKVDNKALPKCEVEPIENVQGQEFDIVLAIIEPNMVSFARANVALTRAKHSLIVLITNPVYKYNKFLSNLAEDACVRGVSSYVAPSMEGPVLKKLVLKTSAATS